MLHKVGLLPAGNFQQVPFAYKMYKRADDVGWEQSNEFKKAFSVDVTIEFIGVWFVLYFIFGYRTFENPGFRNRDTVDSVGIIPKRLPFTTSNTIVRTFRHAVSLDERRAKFKANLWNRPTAFEAKLGKETKLAPLERVETFDEPPEDPKEHIRHGNPKVRSKSTGDISKQKRKVLKEDEHERALNQLERVYSESSGHETNIEEVWFAVCPFFFRVIRVS